MNKSNLINTIKSCSTEQAQLWQDHVTIYIQAHKQYPRLRSLQDKIAWFDTIDADLGKSIKMMSQLGYTTTSDYRIVSRGLGQYHSLTTTSVVRVPDGMDPTSLSDSDTVVLHNITTGIDIAHGDLRYSRNLDADVEKLLG